MKHPIIGYISNCSPDDRKASSGTNFKVVEQLRMIGEVRWIPARTPHSYRILELALKAMLRPFHKNISLCYTRIGARLLSFGIDRKLFAECDVLFWYYGSCRMAYLKGANPPSIYLSDSTFPAMLDYYHSFSNFPRWNIQQGCIIERRGLDRAAAIILSSHWAAQSAVDDLHQKSEKVHILLFGANIDDKDIVPHSYCYDGYLHLLFLGVEWGRKGGDIAVEACHWLNEQGVKAILHVVGIRDQNERIKKLPYVDYVGFLNKNIPEQYDKLVKMLKMAHCLLLPTLAECAGIAFAEAAANGLPVFTHYTGGVPDYVRNGKNGYMLPLGSTGPDFGRKIKTCLDNRELERMSHSAVELYHQELNWQVWGERMRSISRRTM